MGCVFKDRSASRDRAIPRIGTLGQHMATKRGKGKALETITPEFGRKLSPIRTLGDRNRLRTNQRRIDDFGRFRLCSRTDSGPVRASA
ncbi:hypothetical protein QWE_02090 [Agrobacterium albertimagni AOL15]|uniref:Uncharacterized protein n=1 Tax=Agrobacterium albertimagni AOL15 TaxID=1156935 RepID=K2QJJ9_9HYPH|nr:hypothetical protein QWE_02090 [Agrobacterium albertimagni AOL15]